jgi:[acyl-carrier-protein] S-malonyltransferase
MPSCTPIVEDPRTLPRQALGVQRLGSDAVSADRIAILFPGQGSQFEGMADPWNAHPAAALVLAEVAEALGRDLVGGCRDPDALATTAFVQPALLACGVAAFRVLESEGISPAGVAGHSLGEFSALVAAGALDLREAIEVVLVRGEAMQRAGEKRPGTMTALLGVGAEEAAEICAEARGDDVLLVANENSPAQVVLSGSVPAIERAEALAKDRKLRAVRLNVAGAFHSPLMEPAVAAIEQRLDRATFSAPRFPVAENVAGTLVGDPDELRTLLKRHVVSPVRWESCVRALAAAGATSFLEAGPGDVLTKLMKRIVPGAAARAVGSPGDSRAAAHEPPRDEAVR